MPYLIRAWCNFAESVLHVTKDYFPHRAWCVRRFRLSAGFISPQLVYAVLGTSMPQLACLRSSSHLLRACVQPQINAWALDTVMLRYVLGCSLVRAFCHTSCGLWIPYLYDMFLFLPGRASATTISWACFTDVTLDFKHCSESASFR